jgi:hypothetical protein
MTFKDQLQADVQSVFFNAGEFAVAGVYTSADGLINNKAILVIIDYNTDLARTDVGAAAMATLTIKLSDIPRPARYDTVTADGKTFTIDSTLSNTGGVSVIMAESDERGNPV